MELSSDKNATNESSANECGTHSASIAAIYDALIIGSGFSGLGLAIKLKQANINNFVILEKANEVGGTWRDNSYPECRCDVQSHLYSYSFEPNSDWSEIYSSYDEIQRYILRLTEKYQLRSHVQFQQTLSNAKFNEAEGIWTITTKEGKQYKARHFVLGTGPLHEPAYPNIPGLSDFKGKVMHSTQWDHNYDLTNKRVASIGTGGSAIQYAPEVAKVADKMHIFQRTPPWILPRNERKYTQLEKWLFRNLPGLRKLYRSWLYWFNESRILAFKRPKVIKLFNAVAKWHMNRSIKDPALRAKLTPDYVIGCKRILISNRWYPMFNQANVSLVTEGIESISETGITTRDGHHTEVDAIILGTGFITDPRLYLKHIEIEGINGINLKDHWRAGAEAYLGISVSKFPNFYQMMGPNTGTGHNSVIVFIEAQCKYIVDSIQHQQRSNYLAAEIKTDVQSEFVEDIQQQLQSTVWQSGCKSWYQQADGRNFTIWPNSTIEYRRLTASFNINNYEIFSNTTLTQPSTVDIGELAS